MAVSLVNASSVDLRTRTHHYYAVLHNNVLIEHNQEFGHYIPYTFWANAHEQGLGTRLEVCAPRDMEHCPVTTR